MMPTQISKIINKAVQEKLESLAASTLMTQSLAAAPLDTQSSNIANMIAGSGLNGNGNPKDFTERFSRKKKKEFSQLKTLV